MTKDEVKAILGKPTEQYPEPDGTEAWNYYMDFSLAWRSEFCVQFHTDGCVDHTWV